jgi:hypothetical protein
MKTKYAYTIAAIVFSASILRIASQSCQNISGSIYDHVQAQCQTCARNFMGYWSATSANDNLMCLGTVYSDRVAFDSACGYYPYPYMVPDGKGGMMVYQENVSGTTGIGVCQQSLCIIGVLVSPPTKPSQMMNVWAGSPCLIVPE